MSNKVAEVIRIMILGIAIIGCIGYLVMSFVNDSDPKIIQADLVRRVNELTTKWVKYPPIVGSEHLVCVQRMSAQSYYCATTQRDLLTQLPKLNTALIRWDAKAVLVTEEVARPTIIIVPQEQE
jgi:hypothetical protein